MVLRADGDQGEQQGSGPGQPQQQVGSGQPENKVAVRPDITHRGRTSRQDVAPM